MQNLLNDISHRDGPGNNNRFSPADFLVDLDKYTWDKSQAVPLVVIAQWLASSTQKRTNLLWISAFDLAGEHFSDALQVLDTRCQQIAIFIEDSMTQQVLPNGKYAYQSYAKYHETVDKVRLQCRVAMISRKSQSSLGDRLDEHRRARVNLLEAATIPVIGLSEPNTVIRELRQFGFLP